MSALFAKLGTDIEDPLERLQEMAEANRNAKDHHNAISADSLQDWAEFAAPRTFGLAVRAYAGLRLAEKHPVVHNLVISNVPGPPVPLYFMGARIEALYPLGPVFHGAGLNITVMSNDGAGARRRDRLPRVDARRRRAGAALPRGARPAQEGGRELLGHVLASWPAPAAKSRRRALTVLIASTTTGTNFSASSTHIA